MDMDSSDTPSETFHRDPLSPRGYDHLTDVNFNIRLFFNPELPFVRIVATIGPEFSKGYSRLEEIISYGTIRINLAFYDQIKDNYEALIKRIRKNRSDNICILLDAVGPRVKLCHMARGVQLDEGQTLTIAYDKPHSFTPDNFKPCPSDPNLVLGTIFPGLGKYCKIGDPVMLAEGKMRLSVSGLVDDNTIKCTVVRGGILTKRGINLPKTSIDVPALSKRDREVLSTVLTTPHGKEIDFVALSFVRNVKDVQDLKTFLHSISRDDIRIMSKIETQAAVDNIDAIAKESSSLMVARGDLGSELSDPWMLPIVTLDIIEAGHRQGIPVVTATQVLSSMAANPLPTRAEVDELFFLLTNGSDGIMGSEETAIGDHPEAFVDAIRQVSRRVQDYSPAIPRQKRQLTADNIDRNLAGILWAEGTPRVKAIIIISANGNFLKEIYKFRPIKPLILITNKQSTIRYAQQFQVCPVLADFDENDNGALLARQVLKKIGWRSNTETALMIVNHVGPDAAQRVFRMSRLEEIPLPATPKTKTDTPTKTTLSK